MIYGGFSTAHAVALRPEGAAMLSAGSPVWRLGGGPGYVAETAPGRRLMVLGWCGATQDELRRLSAASELPADVAWRWPGTYTVVEERPGQVVLRTDPAGAAPLYAASWRGGWAWSSSARILAGLTEADIYSERLACAVLAPGVPALYGDRSFFTGVQLLAAGSTIELPADGGRPRYSTVWRPDPVPGLPHHRLRETLSAAVALRVDGDPGLSSDLSGGLDSTSLTVLAATCRPRRQPVLAVTMHPVGDETSADLRYARLTADYHRERIEHRLLPVTDADLPYGSLGDVPPGDEPAPSALTHAHLTRQMEFLQEAGSRLHLTGDGGDSVLAMPPVHLADLIRHGRWPRAASEAFGLARLRNLKPAPLLLAMFAVARTGRHAALTALADSLSEGSAGHAEAGDLGWFPLPDLPDWSTPEARKLLTAAAGNAAEGSDPLAGLDIAVRTLVDDIRDTARSAAADAAIAAHAGVNLHNPFLDASVVDAALRTPVHLRPAVYDYKPVLRRAMQHLLPPALAARTTKDHTNAEHFAGLRTHLPYLKGLVADGHLARLGLVDARLLNQHLQHAAAGIPSGLGSLEQALATEAWLHAHHSRPAPAWTTADGGAT